jgi:hypothetical protein
MSRNDITGDEIKSKTLSKQGRENWDSIFQKKTFDEWLLLQYNGQCYRMETETSNIDLEKKIGKLEFEKLMSMKDELSIQLTYHYVDQRN